MRLRAPEDVKVFPMLAVPTGESDGAEASRFHCKLRAPCLTGRRARTELGMPLDIGVLAILEATKAGPLTILGQLGTEPASCGAEEA